MTTAYSERHVIGPDAAENSPQRHHRRDGVTSNPAPPGNTLEYSITYMNAAAQTLGVIVVADRTPPFTDFVSAQCALPLPASLTACNVITQPTAKQSRQHRLDHDRFALSGASGSVLFRVTLQ